MAMRGDTLREHILFAAKTVFLEVGFERASMEEIAARAQTSKRTLYAHFESKENLYLSVIDLVRELLEGKLRTPAAYSADPAEALTLFCGRFLEGLLFVWTVRMCRMSIAEAERFPEGAARYFDVVFTAPHALLSAYLSETFGLPTEAGEDAAERLLGRVTHPRFPRALFGMDALGEAFHEEAISAGFDMEPVRRAVAELLASLPH